MAWRALGGTGSATDNPQTSGAAGLSLTQPHPTAEQSPRERGRERDRQRQREIERDHLPSQSRARPSPYKADRPARRLPCRPKYRNPISVLCVFNIQTLFEERWSLAQPTQNSVSFPLTLPASFPNVFHVVRPKIRKTCAPPE